MVELPYLLRIVKILRKVKRLCQSSREVFSRESEPNIAALLTSPYKGVAWFPNGINLSAWEQSLI